MQIFSAGRTNGTNQPKVVQEVLADLKKRKCRQKMGKKGYLAQKMQRNEGKKSCHQIRTRKFLP